MNLTYFFLVLGAIVPGMISLIVVPWLIFRLARPEITDTEPARELARKELVRMGPLRRDEKWLMLIMGCVMTGWVTSPWHGISNTFVALAGLSAILLARVLTWEDLLDERKAWDALIWFAVLVMMADQLNEIGVIKILSGKLFGVMGGLPWPVLLFVLVASYCYIHYAFAGMTAQVTALYPGFLDARARRRHTSHCNGGASAGVLFQSQRGHDALWHGLSACLFWFGVCAARRVVAHWVFHLVSTI